MSILTFVERRDWTVVDNNGHQLGYITKYGYKCLFYPYEGTVYEEEELLEISNKLKELNK